jgi:hypothetical protein
MSNILVIGDTTVKVLEGAKIIHLTNMSNEEWLNLSDREYKQLIRAQWAKIERAEGYALCHHCKHGADPYEWGEDGSHSYQPHPADVHVKGFAYPLADEGRGYPLNARLCSGHRSLAESPDGDYWYDIKEETEIPFNPKEAK